MLLQVVKELSTARLARSQTNLRSITPEIVYLLSDIYLEKITIWLGFFDGRGDDEGWAVDAMETTLFTLKILRRLLIAGYEYPNHDIGVPRLWQHSQHHFGQFLVMVTQEPPVVVSPAKDLIEKHLIQFSKLHVQMVDKHPAAFALLPNSVDLAQAYWGLVSRFGDGYGSGKGDVGFKTSHDISSSDQLPAMEKLCVKGLTLLRACVRMVHNPVHSFKFKTPEIKAEQQKAKEHVGTQLLTDELITEFAITIVTKFFVFRPADLQSWEEHEDEWEGGASDAWEFEVRPCSEKLFCDLVINYKVLLVDPLLSFFHSVAATPDSSLISRDSVYTAMGLSAGAFYDRFDFDAFLVSTLVNDVSQTGPASKILRRRVAILIAQWITIRVSDSNKPLVYQIYSHLLNTEDQNNDHVVRVTAAREFRIVVEEFGFQEKAFLPFASDILNRIMVLVQEAETTETKLAILETIRAIATRLDQHIAPFTDQIVSMLPGLWDASGEEHLLKQAILTLLSTITGALRQDAVRYHTFILPLIRRAVEPGSDMQVYLMEEALDLWSVVLAQCPAPASVEVVALIECAFPLLEIGSESLRVVLNIVDSYVLLAPDKILGDAVRTQMLSHMTNLLGVNKRELAGLVTAIVEDTIRAASSLGGTDGMAVIANDLHENGFFGRVFAGLRDAWEAHETIGPDRKYPKLDDVVETDYFTILARIAVAGPEVLWNVMSTEGEASDIWEWLSTEWFRHLDCMANIDRQKLSCLALTRILELPPPVTPFLLSKLQDYFSMWTTIVNEMMGGRDDGDDNLIWGPSEGNEFEGAEDVRKRLHSTSDEVHTVHTFQYVKERLRTLVAICGGEDAFQQDWAVNVDKEVIAGFQRLGMPNDHD